MLPHGSGPLGPPGAPYTRDVSSSIDRCQICGQTFSFGLMRCTICRKTFCDSCGVRRGGALFCGNMCAHAFYFGDSDEDTETSEGDEKE
jgi:hypothetical protein